MVISFRNIASQNDHSRLTFAIFKGYIVQCYVYTFCFILLFVHKRQLFQQTVVRALQTIHYYLNLQYLLIACSRLRHFHKLQIIKLSLLIIIINNFSKRFCLKLSIIYVLNYLQYYHEFLVYALTAFYIYVSVIFYAFARTRQRHETRDSLTYIRNRQNRHKISTCQILNFRRNRSRAPAGLSQRYVS